MKKILFFIICLMLPVFAFAASGVDYDDAVHYTNNYIYSFNKYNSYLFFKDKLEYVYEDGVFSYNPNFKSGGMLSKTEYEISNRDGRTFLSNGLEFWTLSKSSGGRHFVLNYRLQEKDDSLKSGVRVTEYVKPNSIVSGRGSYADPWQFSEVLNLHLSSTNIIRGKVSTVPCADASMQKETVTLSFTSGSSVDAYICPASGYTVFSNSCSRYMTKDLNNKYVVSGVSKDNLICNIKFSFSTNAVTLGCNNCNVAPVPSVIYSNKVHDLWFNNKNGLDENKITKLTTLPSKTGYTFKGFYKDGVLIIDTNGLLKPGSTSVITSDVTLNGSFDANQYSVQFSVESPTSTNHTTSANIIYDSTPENIIVPRRAYTVNYNANGGTVGRTQDIVTYAFDGYFYNSVKYFNSDGTAARTWNVPNNVTLLGRWSAGTISIPSVSRPGYRLVGWYDANGTKIEDGSLITKDLHLTARWEAVDVNYTVKHYKENINGSYATPEVETFTAKTATTVTPSVKSYTGFVSPSVQSAVVDGSGTTVIEYRYLRNKYTVTINRNNTSLGTVDKSSLTIKYGTTYSANSNVLTFSDGQKVTASITTVTGYTTTFSGWSSSSGTINANATITANFNRTPIKYTISFLSTNGSYGTVSPTSVLVDYDSTYSVSGNVITFSDGKKVTATPTAIKGYTTVFSGWSSNGGKVSGDASISASFTRTANKYNVIYNCNGGTPTDAYSSNHTYDVSANLTANQCSRSGYSHQGWNTEADGSGTSYANGVSVSNLKSENNDTINLFAQWLDVSAPSCKLKVTSSGVTFESKSDNVGVISFGLIKSSTATYNGKESLDFSTGTFYGYVKDAAGNTGSCSIKIGGTYVSSYTKTTNTCVEYIANYTKTSHTCNSVFKDYTMTTKKCDRSFKNYDKTSQVCEISSVKDYKKVTSTCNSGYSGTCTCKQTSYMTGYNFPCGTYSSCYSLCNAKGYPNYSGTCTLSSTWSDSTTIVPSCTTTTSFACKGVTNGNYYVKSCQVNSYNYAFGAEKYEAGVSSCSFNNFTCNSSNSGKTKVSCHTNFNYNFGSPSTDTVSSCSNNKISCSESTYSQTYVSCSENYDYTLSFDRSTVNDCTIGVPFTCSSSRVGETYVSDCTKNYGYGFDTDTSSVTSCNTTNSFGCNSGNTGSSYVSSCTPAAYECSDSGYTKINNSYCYKY